MQRVAFAGLLTKWFSLQGSNRSAPRPGIQPWAMDLWRPLARSPRARHRRGRRRRVAGPGPLATPGPASAESAVAPLGSGRDAATPSARTGSSPSRPVLELTRFCGHPETVVRRCHDDEESTLRAGVLPGAGGLEQRGRSTVTLGIGASTVSDRVGGAGRPYRSLRAAN